jgi:hypothetical protein
MLFFLGAFLGANKRIVLRRCQEPTKHVYVCVCRGTTVYHVRICCSFFVLCDLFLLLCFPFARSQCRPEALSGGLVACPAVYLISLFVCVCLFVSVCLCRS